MCTLLSMAAAFALMFGVGTPDAAARVYCNITKIETKQLTNGVQITVEADGILNLGGVDREGGGSRFVWREELDLPLGRLGRAGFALVGPVFAAGVQRSLARFAELVEAGQLGSAD